MKKFTIFIYILILIAACVVQAEPQRLTMETVSNPELLLEYLRSPTFDLTNNTITFANAGVVKNTTNGSIIIGEASELLSFAFSENAITMSSSTGVTAIDWGAIAPTFKGNTVFGVDATGVDVTLYADTTGDLWLWDQSDEALEGVGVQLHLDDDTDLQFGTDKDFTVESDTAKTLEFIPLVVDSTAAINIGIDAAGADLKLFGETTGEYLLWDASGDDLIGNYDTTIFTQTGAAANQFKVDATGAIAGYAIVFETTDGGVQINADGADNGDISIDAADDATLTTGGDLTLAVTGTVSAGGSAITNHKVPFEAVTAETNVLAAAETGLVSCVVYTGTHTTTLPQAAAGLIFTVIDGSATAADDVIVDVQAGDNIAGDTNGDGIICTDDVLGSSVTLVAVSATRWIIIESTGTWAQQ